MANDKLSKAKKAKNDEFYTQFADISREIEAYLEYNPDTFRDKVVLLPCDDPEWSNFTLYFAQNFDRLGLRKLISTSYAYESKRLQFPYQPTLFESESLQFDIEKSATKGKIFTLSHDISGDGKIDHKDLEWQYLDGDGDFRSEEVTRLRDEADIIVTNPPFSLFREFLSWVVSANKQFIIIGNTNAITYKEAFPLIASNKMWLGNGFHKGNAYFETPFADRYKESVLNEETGLVKFRNCCWFTNIDHGRRHQPLQLMTMADNLKYSKHKEIRENGYPKYDNYDAIEVAYTDAIPSDYEGVMGVPISFLEKYCPEQFEIVAFRKGNDGKDLIYSTLNGGGTAVFPNTHTQNCDIQLPMVIGPMSMERENMQEYSFATSIPGLIKNTEGKIGEKITYARITIRKIKN